MVRITALMDDKPSENLALRAEHGLSLYVEAAGKKILFDCGASGSTLYNAHRLGIDLNNLDAVVISHSHYDHAAGYRDLIESGMGSTLLYTGPHFFERKFAKDGIRYTDLSSGFDTAFLAEHEIRHCEVDPVMEIFPGIWLVSGFPRTYAFETIPERFVRQTPAGFVKDDFPDEICLVTQADGGLAVLAGCSHPGILNMISHVRDSLKQPVRMVFGGTHLMEADENRVRLTIGELKRMGLEVLGLSHCSGEKASCMIRGDQSVCGCHLAAGDTVFFEQTSKGRAASDAD